MLAFVGLINSRQWRATTFFCQYGKLSHFTDRFFRVQVTISWFPPTRQAVKSIKLRHNFPWNISGATAVGRKSKLQLILYAVINHHPDNNSISYTLIYLPIPGWPID